MKFLNSSYIPVISTHAPLARRDALPIALIFPAFLFLLTRLSRGATQSFMASIKMGSFLLTRLSRGATHFDYTDCPYNCDFYSRASREARHYEEGLDLAPVNFYSRASREARREPVYS